MKESFLQVLIWIVDRLALEATQAVNRFLVVIWSQSVKVYSATLDGSLLLFSFLFHNFHLTHFGVILWLFPVSFHYHLSSFFLLILLLKRFDWAIEPPWYCSSAGLHFCFLLLFEELGVYSVVELHEAEILMTLSIRFLESALKLLSS